MQIESITTLAAGQALAINEYPCFFLGQMQTQHSPSETKIIPNTTLSIPRIRNGADIKTRDS